MPVHALTTFFENQVVLRLARASYVVVTAFAALHIVGGVASVVYGVMPIVHTPMPSEPPENAVIPLLRLNDPVLSAGRLDDWSRSDCSTPDLLALEAPQGPRVVRAAEPHFNIMATPWQSRMETTCAQRNFMGQCLRQQETIAEEGLLTLLGRAEARMSPDDRSAMGAAMDVLLKDYNWTDEERAVPVRRLMELSAAWPGDLTELVAGMDAARRRSTAPVVLDRALMVLASSGGNSRTAAAWLSQTVPAMEDATIADLRLSYEAVSPYTECADLVARSVAAGFPDPDGTFVNTYAREVRTTAATARAEHAEARMTYATALVQRGVDELAAKARKTAALAYGLAGVLGGFLAIALMGLCVAVLAIERHLRAIREAGASLKPAE